MMLPAGVVQSIDANIVDLDNAWIFADADIWSQDYAEVLLQPISVEAVDINDLRFKATEVVLEIRATTDPASAVIWSGYAETVDDPSGGVIGLESRISCGVIDPVPPVFVDNGNGTASIFGFRCAIRPVPDYTQSPSDFEIAPQTLSFVSNTESYVCVRYNSGAPVMYVEANQANINGSDVVLIFVVWRTGNELHSVSTDSRGIGLADKIAGMITRTKPYSLLYGQQLTLGVVATPAVRTVTIAAATIYAGVDAIPLTALNSSNPAQRFTRVAPTAGVYGFLNQTQLDNTNYSNGTNVVAMAANRYSPRWVYRTVGDDVQAFYVLGNEYSNIASAQAAPLPTGLPLVVQDHAVLVGRIIVQNGVDTPVQIDQVESTTFSTSTANMHNNLDGLQGTGPDYYHMDVTRWTNTGNGPWLPLTAGSSNTLTGTLYGTAGAEFGNGALVLVTQGSGSTLAQTYTRGGDLSLAGNSGRANLRIMGSISADTAGVGPGLSFAGVSTGVGPSGGGMLMQLATNNGLDIYSWNNTAWIKKSQINSAGMIAVVGGTAAGFLKANGTIDTTGYLTSINPTYTGRLTGPEQYLENDGQILLAIRRPGGNSGRIHGIAFQAQTLNGTWAEFGRVMTYISSVADGAQIGGMRLYAYDAGTIVQALDAGPTGVTFAGLLSGPRAYLSEFGTLAAMPGDSNYATLHATGVTRTSTNYALRLADSGADTLVNAATTVALAIAGTSKLGVTTSAVNLGSGVALQMSGTTVIDSSRNGIFSTLTSGSGASSGWIKLVANANNTSACDLDWIGGSGSWRRMTARWAPTPDQLQLFTSNDDGSARSTRLAIPRADAAKVVVYRGLDISTGDVSVAGTTVIDASRNAVFASVAVDQHGSVSGTMAGSESWRVIGRQLATNDGYLEIATADANTISPIYVKQYTGTFASPTFTRTLTLLGPDGSSVFPGYVTMQSSLNVQNFGYLQRYSGSSTSSGLYPEGVVPSTTNYVLVFSDSGADTYVNAGTNVHLAVNDISKLRVTSSGVNLVNSAVLQINGTTVIDASRNITGTTIRAEADWSSVNGQVVAGRVGQAGYYSMRRGSDGSQAGGIGWMASATESSEFRHSAGGGGAYQTFVNNSTERLRIATDGSLLQSGSTFLDANRNASFGSISGSSASLTGNLSFTNSGTSLRGINGTMGDNDLWRVVGGATASNAGYLEIATADDGTEPIYVRQYTGVFTSLTRTLTLLDASGNTQLPGSLTCAQVTTTSNGSGQNFRVGDDLWIGDVNESHTARLAGFSDSNQAFLKFGSSGPKLGYNGSTFSLSTGMSFFGDVAINGGLTLPPISVTATLGTLGSNKAQIPSNAATVILARGSSTQYRNYTVAALAPGQIQYVQCGVYGAPENPVAIYAASGQAVYNGLGEGLATSSTPYFAIGILMLQGAANGSVYILNRGDLSL